MEKHEAIKITADEKGVNLKDTLIWFDAINCGAISFLSSAFNSMQGLSKNTQYIHTAETAKLLEAIRKKPHALTCQYNRPFSIGSIKMELLPAGSLLGAASLYLEKDDGRLLYAPAVHPQQQAYCRKMQLKKADVLLLNADIANLKKSLPTKKKEKERLLDKVFNYKKDRGFYPAITASSIGTSQELTALFSEEKIPVAVHSQIAKINRIYGEFGIDLGQYSVLSKYTNKEKLVILPYSYNFSRPTKLAQAQSQDVFCVSHDEQSFDNTESFEGLSERFLLNNKADGPELKEIITAVQPKKVLITGPYTSDYVHELKSLSAVIAPVYKNDQPSLFGSFV